MAQSGAWLLYDQALRQADREVTDTAVLLAQHREEATLGQVVLGTDGARRDLWSWLLEGSGIGLNLLFAGAYALVLLVLEPFYAAAGFAMYLNRRVELEAWDVEQEFRRAFAH